MADLLGETAAVGELYVAVGTVIKKDGTDVTIGVGESSGFCGKPQTVKEDDSLNLLSLAALVTLTAVEVDTLQLLVEPSAIDLTYTDGAVTLIEYDETSKEITLVYNADGTVDTIHDNGGGGGLAHTKTFIYNPDGTVSRIDVTLDP